MKQVAEHIRGYTYGTPEVGASPVSVCELDDLKTSVGLSQEDIGYLRLAGGVLEGQTKELVALWRNGIIAGIPHLSRHSRTPEGEPLPEYTANSGLRFEQWILDSCLRPYDQDWLNYQQEIALRHTSLKKNQVDGARSTPFVPLRDIIAFVVVMNVTIKPYFAAKGHSSEDVNKMHQAWCKSMQLQMALWTRPYMHAAKFHNEW